MFKPPLLAVLLPVIFFQSVTAQIDGTNKGWKIALNAGLFLSSNHPASFYNGSEENENKISFILKNPYHFQEIMGLLEASDTFFLHGIPTRMQYSPTVLVGINFRNNFRENMAWFLQFNQMKLLAKDVYTLEVDPLDHIATDPDLRTFTIWGEEQRYLFDFGISREFEGPGKMFRPFLEGGFTLANVKVKANKIKVADREYSLINIYGNKSYIPNSNMQTFDVDQGGIGYGGFINIGMKLYVNTYFSLDPTLHVYFTTTRLEPYQQLRPHFFFNLRLSVNNLFMFQEKHL